MKALKTQYFGSITLGVCSVRLFKRADKFEVRMSQGTSSKYQETFDATHAEEIFKAYCEEALKDHGEYIPTTKGK